MRIADMHSEIQKPDKRQLQLFCDLKEDTTRQEFAAESEVKNILSRHGGVPEGPTPTYGEINYDLNLQVAIRTLADERAAWHKIPLAIRQEYPTWNDLIRGIKSKKLKAENGKIMRVEPTAPATPAAPQDPKPATTTVAAPPKVNEPTK